METFSLVELHQAKSVPEGLMRLSSRFAPTGPVDPSAGETSRPFSPHHPTAEDQSMHTPVRERETPTKSKPRIPSPERGNCLTIEGAIQSYLQTHHKARQSPKTLERQCAPTATGTNVSGPSPLVSEAGSFREKRPWSREKHRRRAALPFRKGSFADEQCRGVVVYPPQQTSREQRHGN